MTFLRSDEDNAKSSSPLLVLLLFGDELDGDSDAVEDDDSIEDESSVDRKVTLSRMSGKFDSDSDTDEEDDAETVVIVVVVLAVDDMMVY